LKVLFDTNVVLDVLLDREPYAEAAAQLFSKVENGELVGSLCATTITTVYYLTTKALDAEQALDKVQKLLHLFEVAAVNRPVLEAAIAARFADFENAVIYAAARHTAAESIVTRNAKDFMQAQLPIHTPDALLKILDAKQS
jgi:predicted nucleic acid-binding protein